MKKFGKAIFGVLALTSLFSFTFYFWGSSGWIDEEDHNRVVEYGQATPPKDTLTVMTYNLGYLSGMTNNLPLDRPDELFKTNLSKARSLIGRVSPDIIGFQEIDFDSHRSNNYNQLDSLNNFYHQGFASVNWDKRYVPFPYWPPSLHFGKMLSGQAILSKFPMEKIESVTLEHPSEAPFYYRAFYLDRLVQMANIQIGNTSVKVMNVHMEAFFPETREKQAHEVKALFEKHAAQMPVIFLGDFNSEAPWVEGADEVMKIILSSEFCASAISPMGYKKNPNDYNTFSSGDPQKMIDFILYNDNFIEIIEARVISEAGDISDHLPVAMSFTFK